MATEATAAAPLGSSEFSQMAAAQATAQTIGEHAVELPMQTRKASR